MFENLLNFRDLGGRVTADGARVRTGRLFRSESVAYLSAAAPARLVDDLLEPGALPAVVHCEAGCDRTGVVAAAVFGLLGVPDEAIIADYDLTRAAFPAMNARWKAMYVARGNPPDRFIEETWVEREAAMARTIAMMRERWGDWAGWAQAYGLTDDERERLRKLLVD